jgi:Tfp pilus assembly protein PilE
MIVFLVFGLIAAITIPSFKKVVRDRKEAEAVQQVEVVSDITKTHNIYITNIVTMTITKTVTNYVDVLKDDTTSKYESMNFRLRE